MKLHLLARLFIITALLPFAALAQEYPNKPVRTVIAFPPGGSNDLVARVVFQKVSEITGQSFVIDNRGGSAGVIGSGYVANSAKDGYTILVQSATHLANPFLYKQLPYDTMKDFTGVSTLARQVSVLAANPSFPAKTTAEFIKMAKEQPGRLAYGSGGIGATLHLQMVLLASMAGIDVLHVPYRGGGPAIAGLLSGDVPVEFIGTGSFMPYYKAGTMRGLGVTTKTALPQFPDIPPIADAVPGYEFLAWVGCFVPAGTPQAVVDRLNSLINQALADPQVVSKLSEFGLDVMPSTPAAFAARLKEEYPRYEQLIKSTGIQPQGEL